MNYFVEYLPITTGNNLKLYVDGEEYCSDLYSELHKAKKFVFLTGLHFMANFRLIRKGLPTDNASFLSTVLTDLGYRGIEIFLLVNQFWTDESEVVHKTAPIRKKIMEEGELHGYLHETFTLFKMLRELKNIHCVTDIHQMSRIFGTNHQKTVVIDDKVAFLGGIDLTYLDGDRWDTHKHSVKNRAIDRTYKFWHDVHLRVEGPSVQFVRDNFVQRWKYGHLHTLSMHPQGGPIEAKPYDSPGQRFFRGRKRPDLPSFPASKYQYPTGGESPDLPTVQIVRSMPFTPNWRSEMPPWNKAPELQKGPSWKRTVGWERSCKDAYLIGIRAARKYIYLENQWIADEDIWNELIKAANLNYENPDFRIILMVPYEGLFAAGLGSNQELWIGSEMEHLIEVSNNEGTFGMYSLLKKFDSSGQEQKAQIYIHSKIMIIDDEWALIGSANAGGISLEGIRTGRNQPDTELSAIILDKKFAANFRKILWEEHLGMKVSSTYEPRDADKFRRLAAQPFHKIRFFPGYDKIKKPKSTEDIPISLIKKYSRIIPSFPDWWRDSLPVALMTATFQACVVPPAPPGYRCYYRWRCELFHGREIPTSGRIGGEGFRMRGIKLDEVLELGDYTDQDIAYIGKMTADSINSKVKDVEDGRILCRVQIVPLAEGPDPSNEKFPSFLLEYNCQFMNSELAKANLEPGRLP